MLNDLETHLSDRRDPLFASLQRRKIQALTAGRNGCGKVFALRIDLKLLRDDHGQLQRSNLSADQLESMGTQSLPLKTTQPADCP
jgi:ABC-type transport system involved in cytochrome c biogenesis ATPase subunit